MTDKAKLKRTFYQCVFSASADNNFDLDRLLDSLNEFGDFHNAHYVGSKKLKIWDAQEGDYANIYAINNTHIEGVEVYIDAYPDKILFYAMASASYHNEETHKAIDELRNEMAGFRIFEERY